MSEQLSYTRETRMAFRIDLRLAAMVGLLMVLVQVCGAATGAKEDNCSVTREPDGFKYKPIQPRLPEGVRIDWETGDGTSVAIGPELFKELVANLTKDSITLRNCSDHVRAKWQKSGRRDEANCKVNCSALNQPAQPMVVCSFLDKCPDGVKLGLGIAGALVAVGALVVVGCCLCSRRRRSVTEKTIYTSVGEGTCKVQINPED